MSFFDESGRSYWAGRASAKPSDFFGDGFDHEEPHGFAGDEGAECKRRRGHDARRCRGRPTPAGGGDDARRLACRGSVRTPQGIRMAVPGGRHGRVRRLLSARVPSFWPAFVLLVIADDAMYAPYRPFFAGISDRHRARRRRGDRLDQQLRRAGLLRRYLARHAHRQPGRVLLLVAASLLISGLITLAVGVEEVRAVAAGLSPHP